jgi:thymidylate synthase (FAD)
MIEILKKWVPLTYEAFVKNRLSSLTLSADAIDFIKKKLNRKKVSDSNLSKRELQTLKEVFDL